MPAATQYSPDDKDLRSAAETELTARRTDIALAWAYYDGEHKQNLKIVDGIDDNVIVNLYQQVVDRTKSFLFPTMPRLELNEMEDTEDERWLRDAWDQRGKGSAVLLNKVAENGSMAGHVFVKVAPAQAGEEHPRIVNLDPANCLCFWKDDDYEMVLWYEIHWSVGKTEYRQDIVNRGDTWLTRDFKREKNTSGGYVSATPVEWTFMLESEWNYPLGPIVDWQHLPRANRYYGKSDATNLKLNDKVNKVASDIGKILRFHAGPRTVGTGFTAEQVTPTAIENFWTIPDPQAKVANLEMQTDLASSMNYLQFLKDSYMSKERVVVLKGSVAEFQRTTNLSIRTLYIDQLAKNEELRRNYGEGIKAISKRMLMLGGKSSEVTVRLHWDDPLPTDPLETVNVLKTERELGIVSQETMARERGRDWDQEQERMEDEDDQDTSLMERMARQNQFPPRLGGAPIVQTNVNGGNDGAA